MVNIEPGQHRRFGWSRTRAAGVGFGLGAALAVSPLGWAQNPPTNQNGTTDTIQRASVSSSIMRACGLRQQAVGSGTLPSTLTFATWSQAMHPFFGAVYGSSTF